MESEIQQLDSKKQEDAFEGQSLAHALKAKREATDKILENTKVN